MHTLLVIITRFQSTLPRRERRYTVAENYRGIQISIHAPTKGATKRIDQSDNITVNFNPRSHEGSDMQALRLHME